jgi:hypothetical protein
MICEFLPEVGKATTCEASKSHAPKPLRFVWHHVLPRTCGGQTIADNLASVCDNCHYGIHAILFELSQNNGRAPSYQHLTGSGRYAIALRGYEAAVAAGTVVQIPNEGAD